ncbi:hypothetical protein ACFVYE_16835 [Streptomyces sp. NPDC058239]|uniref:hypothetical protein n=1 Tax=Streptomyces sp. NPDC058239 TaxID=3346395 RepID=UPI0036E32205
MARHALSKSRRRALLRAGLTVTAVGAALGAGGAAAQAAPLPLVPAAGADSSFGGVGEAGEATGSAATGTLGHSLENGIAPVTHLRLDPLAGTGVDPLDNSVGTQVADFKPLSTAAVTGPVAGGGALKDLPVVGQVTEVLHG